MQYMAYSHVKMQEIVRDNQKNEQILIEAD